MKISVREMRDQLGKLDDLMAEEHELILTRHGKAVARILPINAEKPKPSHKSLRDSLPYQNISSEVLLRQDRDER